MLMLKSIAALGAAVGCERRTARGTPRTRGPKDSSISACSHRTLTSTPPGTVEVIEVFSYACPACNSFRPLLDGLKASLPKVKLAYVAASFRPDEDWLVFQARLFTLPSGSVSRKRPTVQCLMRYGNPASSRS